VRGLLLAPRDELPKTLPESGELKALLFPYVLVLAAIAPVAGYLSQGVFGSYQPSTRILQTEIPAMWVRAPGVALVAAIVRFAISIGAFILLGRVLDWLAPRFGGKADRASAMKTAACASTPVWLAGATAILGSMPGGSVLAPLILLAGLIYGVLIGSLGATQNLQVSEGRAIGLSLAAFGIVVVATALAYWLCTALMVTSLLV
jgi:hypothetical protein